MIVHVLCCVCVLCYDMLCVLTTYVTVCVCVVIVCVCLYVVFGYCMMGCVMLCVCLHNTVLGVCLCCGCVLYVCGVHDTFPHIRVLNVIVHVVCGLWSVFYVMVLCVCVCPWCLGMSWSGMLFVVCCVSCI